MTVVLLNGVQFDFLYPDFHSVSPILVPWALPSLWVFCLVLIRHEHIHFTTFNSNSLDLGLVDHFSVESHPAPPVYLDPDPFYPWESVLLPFAVMSSALCPESAAQIHTIRESTAPFSPANIFAFFSTSPFKAFIHSFAFLSSCSLPRLVLNTLGIDFLWCHHSLLASMHYFTKMHSV